MNLEKDFVPREQALALKEIGYNEDCIAVTHRDGTVFSLVIDTMQSTQIEGFVEIKNSECDWEDDEESINGIQEVATPTYSQVFRWFRDKHKLHNGIYPYYDKYEFQIKDFRLLTATTINGGLMSYKQAELKCLVKLIEMVKNK